MENTTTSDQMAVSQLDIGGDWETRKISVMGTLSSFITSLRIGDEITKISLPSVLLAPYSALELAASRGLSHCHLLLQANREKDPFRRLLCVLRWFLGYTQKEKLKRKPCNPIQGETHIAWVHTKETEELPTPSVTKYFSEQTSHHPPISAFIIHNEEENIEVHANIIFSTKFYGNSAGVITSGLTHVDLKNHGERYTFSKSMPDLAIRNMVFGTKRIAWEGDVTLNCEASGYHTTLHYKEEGRSSTNTVTGFICKNPDLKTKLWKIHGPCGEVITLKDATNNSKHEEVLLDCTKLIKNKMNYLPWGQLEETSSLKVWEELSKAIVIDDMYKADAAKRLVEEAQRKRRTEGKIYEAKYFRVDPATTSHTLQFWELIPDKMKDINAVIYNAIDHYKTNSKQ